MIFEGDRTFPFPVSPYLAAKWDYWALRGYSVEPRSSLTISIRDSGHVDDAMRRRIEDDLFHGSVRFVRSYPITLSNMDPAILRGLIAAGRVLAEPAYVHEAVQWIADLIRKQFFVDGMWREAAVSYHNQTVHGLADVMELLKGYSDPKSYIQPESGARYDNLDLLGSVSRFLKKPDGFRISCDTRTAALLRYTIRGHGSIARPLNAPDLICLAARDMHGWGGVAARIRCRRTSIFREHTDMHTRIC